MNRNRKLESVLNGWPWAYTGSLAMKIHANRLGKGNNLKKLEQNIRFLTELKNIERNMNSRAQRGMGASRV